MRYMPTKGAFVVATILVIAEAVVIYELSKSDDPFGIIAVGTTLLACAFVLFLVYSFDAGYREWRERRRQGPVES